MAEAAAAAARSSLRAAATETRVHACDDAIIGRKKIDLEHSPCSVLRVHGRVVIFHESRKIGDVRSKEEHDDNEPPDLGEFDHRMEVTDLSLFRSFTACRDLVHRMLAEGPVTRQYDLAADNWDDFQPEAIATIIVASVLCDSKDARGVVHAYAFDIEMDLSITLTYSEPKALLLACKEVADEIEAAESLERGWKRRRCEITDETEAAGALARGQKRRHSVTAGELCAICFLDLETEGEEITRLPCSHSFHTRCIVPWFYRASTYPTCRRDAMECFGYVRSVSIEHS